MPLHNRFFRNQDGQSDPQALMALGPLLAVEISLPRPLTERLEKDNQSPPSPVAGWALIDTGASRSGVDRKVIEGLSVQPVGITDTLTAGGRTQQQLFPAHFRFPQETIDIAFSSVLGVNLEGHQAAGRPLSPCLAGMCWPASCSSTKGTDQIRVKICRKLSAAEPVAVKPSDRASGCG
jgi:hypothetical protein